MDPGLAQLAVDALRAPGIQPDDRAGRARRAPITDTQRRRQVRPVL
ncbi:hypothetical protein KZO11_02200 [Streptomyces anulatus]|nr:hypothetical protein [Streptomyces anulatus]QYA92590.1 hypothetical protein KZO11_02200 [Streptomyces anulatus]